MPHSSSTEPTLPSTAPRPSRVVGTAQVLALAVSGAGHHEAHDQAVEAQGLGEDEDQDHAHEQARLLRVRADTRVAHNADRETCCQRAHAYGETSTKVRIAGVGGVRSRLHFAVDDDCG